jgi:hypothetical protein
MKKFLLTILALVYIIPSAAAAYDWQSLGWTVISTSQIDGKTSTVVRDERGNSFTIVEAAPLTTRSPRNFPLFRRVLRHDDLKIESLTFQVNEDSFEASFSRKPSFSTVPTSSPTFPRECCSTTRAT